MTCIDCGAEKKSRNGSLCLSCGRKAIGRANRRRAQEAPSEVCLLTDVEAAWLGGVIEADGSVSVRIDARGYEDVDIHFYNSEVETVATVLRLVGAGSVYYRGERVSSKWPAGRKPQWAWNLQRKASVRELLKQIIPYLTGKQGRARLGVAVLSPVAGGSCHPSHDLTNPTDQELQVQEERERTEKKQLEVDPRKIQRQHRWKLGHDPVDSEDHDDPDVAYLKIEYTGEETEPDQLEELQGGPDSAMPCQIALDCDRMMKIVGRKSMWDVYMHPKVSVVNLDTMTEARKAELMETYLLILVCPDHTSQKIQMREDVVPLARD